MNILIREKRKLVFDGKRITPKAIRQFASLIDHEYSSTVTEYNPINIIYSVDATDNSSYESKSIVIFEKNEILDKKPIQKVRMNFKTDDYSKNIELQILQSPKSTSENYIIVSGDDTIWVNGMMTRFNEILNLCERQPTNYREWVGWISFFIYILSNILYFHLFAAKIKALNSAVLSITFALVIPLGGLLLLMSKIDVILDMWPSIELQTGPNYLQIPQQKRNRLILIITMIGIPLLVALIYDILKSSFGLF